MNIKTVGKEIGIVAAYGALGFGLGCLAGKLGKAPILKTGGYFSVSMVASCILDSIVKSMAKKHKWNFSSVKFINVATRSILTIALAVSGLALGLLSPMGAGIAVGISLAFEAIPLTVGLFAKYGGNDCTYSESLRKKSTLYQM